MISVTNVRINNTSPPGPAQATVLVSLVRSVVCFHEKNAEKTWKWREETGDWRLGTTRHRNSHGEPGPDQARLYYSLPRPELRPCSRDSLEQANKINYINIILSTAKPGPLQLLIVG